MTTSDQTARPSFFRRYKIAIIAVLAFAVFQSITISLPINGRVVDQAGKPIAGAEIAALWLVKVVTLIDTGPGGAVRVSHITSDAQGRFRVPGAFIVHTPTFPFSWLWRTNDMPRLVVVARGYRVALATNDVFGIDGPPHSSGFWFVRTSSLRGSDIKLLALADLASRDLVMDAEAKLSIAKYSIQHGQYSCDERFVCVANSLEPVLKVIQQSEQEIQGYFKR